MNHEADVLKEVAARLEKANISYMLTGSMAANLYAVPRMTRDIDIVIQLGTAHAHKIHQVFKSDFYIDLESISEAIENESGFNMIHNESIVKIDFILRKEAPYRKLEFERKRKVVFEGQEIWVVSPEDLIISKLNWAKEDFSELQLRDVKNLLKQNSALDYPYLEEWISNLGLNPVYERLKA